MQEDVVIIPTFDRPEMLWLCLDHLKACPDSQQTLVKVYVDSHVGHPPPKFEIEQVVRRFAPYLSLQVEYRRPHTFHGNSFNVLAAFHEAYGSEFRHVFLVEDDVMISPQFFQWHWAQHLNPRVACSIGMPKEPQHSLYASMGVCFKRDTLKLIIPHCTQAYLQDMVGYCRRTFPPSRLHCEQDGLWCRVLTGSEVIWATEPLSQHVGWYGYHRPRSHRPQGSLEQKYEQVRDVLGNPDLLRSWARDFGDVKPLSISCN